MEAYWQRVVLAATARLLLPDDRAWRAGCLSRRARSGRALCRMQGRRHSIENGERHSLPCIVRPAHAGVPGIAAAGAAKATAHASAPAGAPAAKDVNER